MWSPCSWTGSARSPRRSGTAARQAAELRAALRDYRDWRALGPGGLPANPLGWLVTTALRPLVRETTSTGRYPRSDGDRPALVLPARPGPRPTVNPHPIPQRQLDQLPDAADRAAARLLTPAVVARDGQRLALRRSRLERRGEAAFHLGGSGRPWWLEASRGEIGHVHPADGSLHLVLAPADARAVIEAGWGERHPLAGVPLLGLPSSYLLLYAPRDAVERDVVTLVFSRAAGLPDPEDTNPIVVPNVSPGQRPVGPRAA